ncbi:uncharacterized protein LOC120826748 [Gasterosteus aculeatus]
MSSWSLLCVCLCAASLLLPAVVRAQYYEPTVPPDYGDYGDYNVTFDYSFYSNASSEDLDQFSKLFKDEEEDTEGRRKDVTVTMTTTQETTERGGVNVLNAASLPVPLEIRMLLWTLVTLISLQHTL